MEYPPRQSDTFVYHPTTAQFTAASSTSYAKQILSPASDSPSPSPSPQPSANENPQRITRINFLHFDQECDFGVETESGQRVRKRKRPGRKPNPPSLQERRAQNRAAQRAFREREQLRKQEKEREWRAQAEEIAYLRKRLEQVEYEANYLRGYVLLLTLSGLVERGSVPHVWTDTRWFHAPWDGSALPPDIHQDNLDELPAILQTVLNRDSQILSFADAVTRAERHGCKFSEKRVPFPVTKPSEKRSDDMEELLTSNTASESMVSAFTATKPVVGTITECPTLKTPDDLAHMPSLQALHILRLQLKSSSVLGDKFRLFFTPTALQRLIPHDVRIDYIAGPSMRDRLILFQGLYDADECFQLLSSKIMFVGGDLRISRNWVPPPEFSEKFWFLSHHLFDIPINADELASQHSAEEAEHMTVTPPTSYSPSPPK